MLEEVKSVLLSLKSKEDENRRTYGKGYNQNDYIFKHPDGTPFRPDCVTRGFQRVIVKHDFPKMRFHDLRHSTASILYDLGWDIKDIQEWLGHTDLETTANIYTHISATRRVALGKNISGTFLLNSTDNNVSDSNNQEKTSSISK